MRTLQCIVFLFLVNWGEQKQAGNILQTEWNGNSSNNNNNSNINNINNNNNNKKYLTRRWSVQQRNVCFGTSGRGYGSFTMKYTGPLVELKLFHKFGEFTCAESDIESIWGCPSSPHLSIPVTDGNNNLVFPGIFNREDLLNDGGYSRKSLTLNNSLMCDIYHGMILRLWNGDRFHNTSKTVSFGRTCVDVYSRIVKQHETSQNCKRYNPRNAMVRRLKWGKLYNNLHGSAGSRVVEENRTEDIVEQYGRILDVDSRTMAEAEHIHSTATWLLKKIKRVSESMAKLLDGPGSNVTISAKNFALQVARVRKSDLNIRCHLHEEDRVGIVIDDLPKTNITSNFLASIAIPSSAIKNPIEVIQSRIYLKSTLFVDKNRITNSSHTRDEEVADETQSAVLSVSLESKVSQLNDPITLMFRKRSKVKQSSVCKYWELREGSHLGYWSAKGCHFINESTDHIVTCQCNHLTDFAVLMDIHPSNHQHLSLQICTWIGSLISLPSLLITIVIFSFFPDLRAKLASKILLCLCISLALLLLVFVVGIDRCRHRIPCEIISVILQYLLLTSFAWMAVTAVIMFHLLVFVSVHRGNERKFFIRASIAAWGCPVIIVVTTALLQPHGLANQNFCFPHGRAAYFGVLMPIFLVLTLNFFVLISVLVKFRVKRRRRSRDVNGIQESQVNFRQTRMLLTITVLLGLTWIVGVFAIGEVELVFELLFCILNSLQGFFIFLSHVVTNTDVRKEVKAFIQKHLRNSVQIKDCKRKNTERTNDVTITCPINQRTKGRRPRARSNEELVLVLLQNNARSTTL